MPRIKGPTICIFIFSSLSDFPSLLKPFRLFSRSDAVVQNDRGGACLCLSRHRSAFRKPPSSFATLPHGFIFTFRSSLSFARSLSLSLSPVIFF